MAEEDQRRTGIALLKQIRFDEVAVNLQLRWKIIEFEATDPLRELSGLSGHFTANIVNPRTSMGIDIADWRRLALELLNNKRQDSVFEQVSEASCVVTMAITKHSTQHSK